GAAISFRLRPVAAISFKFRPVATTVPVSSSRHSAGTPTTANAVATGPSTGSTTTRATSPSVFANPSVAAGVPIVTASTLGLPYPRSPTPATNSDVNASHDEQSGAKNPTILGPGTETGPPSRSIALNRPGLSP